MGWLDRLLSYRNWSKVISFQESRISSGYLEIICQQEVKPIPLEFAKLGCFRFVKLSVFTDPHCWPYFELVEIFFWQLAGSVSKDPPEAIVFPARQKEPPTPPIWSHGRSMLWPAIASILIRQHAWCIMRSHGAATSEKNAKAQLLQATLGIS